ncbi:hypothetical protein FRC07_013838, partial [Ceratobasidium sp. 392]
MLDPHNHLTLRPFWFDHAPQQTESQHGLSLSEARHIPAQYPPDSYDYSPDWVPRSIELNTGLFRVRELGFQLGLHDVPAACLSVLSLAMEPGVHEQQEREGEEYKCQGGLRGEYEGEYGNEDQYGGTDRYTYMELHQSQHEGDYQGARTFEYEGQGTGSWQFAGAQSERANNEGGDHYSTQYVDDEAGGTG